MLGLEACTITAQVVPTFQVLGFLFYSFFPIFTPFPDPPPPVPFPLSLYPSPLLSGCHYMVRDGLLDAEITGVPTMPVWYHFPLSLTVSWLMCKV